MPYTCRKNIELGKLDAETDSFLDSCFYKAEVFKGIINFDNSEQNPDFTRRIIVGRTGSGKTALLKQILNDEHIRNHETIEAENTVFEHIQNNVFISTLMEKDIDLRAFYKSLWLHVLLIKVIQILYKKSYDSFFDFVKSLIGKEKVSYRPELADEYLERFKDHFFNNNVITEITNKLQDDLSCKLGPEFINSKGKLSNETQEKIQKETSSYVSKELLTKQKELIKLLKSELSNQKQIKIVISIDDLDKSWLSSSSIRYDFINALLDAFRELLDVKSVKILIAIRTDILMGIYKNSLRQHEKDQSLIYPISWNKKEILAILDSRINHLIKNQYSGSSNTKFNDIFGFSVKGLNASDYIIDRTMLRPRDAINFVNNCFAECDGEIELNEDIVIAAEEKFYSSRKGALVQEWTSIYPCVMDYIDSLSFLKSQEFHEESLDKKDIEKIQDFLMDRDKSTSTDKFHENIVLNFKELVKVWFIIGVIGIKKSDSVIIYSSFEKSELDITDLNKTFIIHPLFFRN